jgi:membrane-associated protease RseP (regulator of RpoE activity)
MPSSPPDSSGSPPPSAMPSAEETAQRAGRDAAATPLEWRTNAWLFLATVASCFITFRWGELDSAHPARSTTLAEAINLRVAPGASWHALQFTVALLAILLAHEFGHYIAARIHKVDASLPFFIPLPMLSPFGTMGAVIRMRAVIPTRRALLDIGASGPLAGLAVAIPVYAWGVAHSGVAALDGTQGIELGDSLLLRALDHLFGPVVPEGMDVMLSPVAYAGWAGMFVTMMNLVPVSQLDAGHVAFSLFGPRQDRIAPWVHRSTLAFFFVSLASFTLRDVRAGFGLYHLGHHVGHSLFWLVWFEVLAIVGTLSSPRAGDRLGIPTRAVATLGLALLAGVLRDDSSLLRWAAWFASLGVLLTMEALWGALRSESTLLDHPPTGAQPLSRPRVVVAVITLAFFFLLFLPVPFAL